MGKRLSKIVTKTGDNGTTGLGDGSRVTKDDVIIEAIGNIDELNCIMGLIIQCPLKWFDFGTLEDIQHRLFDLGGELSMPSTNIIDKSDVEYLENLIILYNKNLSPLENFILPGGSPAAAYIHLARAVCRRAERSLVKIDSKTRNPETLKYLNRLSDLLFIIARVELAGNEVIWKPKEKYNV